MLFDSSVDPKSNKKCFTPRYPHLERERELSEDIAVGGYRSRMPEEWGVGKGCAGERSFGSRDTVARGYRSRRLKK